MAICVFAFLRSPMPELEFLGLGGEPLRYVRLGDLVAAINMDVDLAGLEQADQEIWLEMATTYAGVQGQLFSKFAILPLSLRSAFFADFGTLENFLLANETLLGDRLQDLAGYAEYTLWAKCELAELSDAVEDKKGRAYFAAKQKRFTDLEEQRSRVKQEGQSLVELIQSDELKVCWAKPREGEQLRAYLLLEQNGIMAMKQALLEWQEKHLDWQVELGDALPPYSFVDF